MAISESQTTADDYAHRPPASRGLSSDDITHFRVMLIIGPSFFGALLYLMMIPLKYLFSFVMGFTDSAINVYLASHVFLVFHITNERRYDRFDGGLTCGQVTDLRMLLLLGGFLIGTVIGALLKAAFVSHGVSTSESIRALTIGWLIGAVVVSFWAPTKFRKLSDD